LPNRKNSAYHEAAHAFFFELYGSECKWVAIQDEGIGGECRANFRGLTPTPDEAFENGIISLAGRYAELRLRDGVGWANSIEDLAMDIDQELDDYDQIGDTHPELFSEDIIDLKNQLEYLVGEGSWEEWQQCIKEFVARSALAVNEYWPCITAIAEKLLEKGYLTGPEVRDILKEADNPVTRGEESSNHKA
jgi:hypothetical protein